MSNLKSTKQNIDDENIEIFQNKNFYILPNGMGKNRIDLFKSSLLKYGANLVDEKSDNLNFEYNKSSNLDSNINLIIIYDEKNLVNWDSIEKALLKKKFYPILKNELETNGFDRVRVVNTLWLSECLKMKSLVSTKSFELSPSKIKENKHAVLTKENKNLSKEKKKAFAVSQDIDKKQVPTSSNNTSVKRIISESDSEQESPKRKFKSLDFQALLNSNDSDDSENEEFFSANDSSPEKKINSISYTCAHSSNEQNLNHNKKLTDKLEELGSIYDKTKDRFRAISYQKAALALKQHNKPVTSYDEAIKLKGIGHAIALKIAEIAETGELKKLDYLNSREDLAAIKIFSDIHGVGPTTAQSFINQGFRTLDDLKTKANLNRQQKIGLKYYDEFKERIPRSEVAEIEKTVKDAALSINSGLIIETCGSYRRGKATCGDVDILITHPDGHTQKTIFNKLLDILHGTGFLTDDLVVQDENSDSQRKYLGVCKLAGETTLHRRLDIIIVPYNEYACALLYFTGSAHFNRSMRLLAKQNGMSLSEHSLNKNVKRKGSEKIHAGEPLPAKTEADVFKHLNLEYRTPQERDF